MKSARLLAIFFTILVAANLAAISQLEVSTLKTRAALGDNSAKYRLGKIHELEGTPEGYEKMIEYFRPGADAGHPQCMAEMAKIHLYGLLVLERDQAGVLKLVMKAPELKDQADGLKLLTKAVDLKAPDALYELAFSHFDGLHGFPKDEKRGRELMDEACALGSLPALTRRSLYYESGTFGYTKDAAAAKRDALAYAIRMEETAPDLDSHKIQGVLYAAYRDAGRYGDARKWQDKAIQGGNYAATLMRAIACFEGSRGETKDMVQAYALYNLAASLADCPSPRDSKMCAAGRDNAAKEMTGAQIAEAQRLSTEMNAKIRK